jgi:hypothetical protein
MNWEEYCLSKKIDCGLFQKSDPEKWLELKGVFEQIHPNSFTEQKKFIINDIRRRYLLKDVPEDNKREKTTVLKPAIKIPPGK